MSAELPTFMGGVHADLDWLDFSPEELMRATVGSMVRAEYAARIAGMQAQAAGEQGDRAQQMAYHEHERVLGFMSGRKTMSGKPRD